MNLTANTRNKFYQAITKEIPLSAFEEWVYNTPSLENELGEDIYFRLISFDYNSKDQIIWLEDLVVEIMGLAEFQNHYVQKAIEMAGWYKDRSINNGGIILKNQHAHQIIAEYGGLKLREGRPIDILTFDSKLTPWESEWVDQVGELTALARDSGGYYTLLINSKGECYLLIDMLWELYHLGSFHDALRKWIFHLDLGESIHAVEPIEKPQTKGLLQRLLDLFKQ